MKFGQFCNVDGTFAVSNRVGEPGIAGSHAAGLPREPVIHTWPCKLAEAA
ncbi:hypothetical protein ACVITL_005907 [Rhizobium pisi]|jgi:hypothetical protein